MRIATGGDLETTGLLDPEHRIIEIALCMYDLDTEKQVAKFVRRFNPGRPIDPKAIEVHGITFDQVSHLPKLEDDAEAIALIQRIISKTDVLVAHNGIDFDLPFLAMEFARIGKHLPHCPVVDTMKSGRWATPWGKVPNLKELCFACGIEYDVTKAHAASYDVEVMMACFFHALRSGFYTLPASVSRQVDLVA